jgi:hypothetical protein
MIDPEILDNLVNCGNPTPPESKGNQPIWMPRQFTG